MHHSIAHTSLRSRMWSLLAETGRLACALGILGLAAAQSCATDIPLPPAIDPALHRVDKKMIEFGWDLPTASYVRQHIATMEQRPFDGLMFAPGDEVPMMFSAKPWPATTVDLEALAGIRWNRFTDNFLLMWSNDREDMDYFNDAHWQTILANLRRMSHAVKVARCKGVVFDTEFYSARSPWEYSAARYPGRTRADVDAKVRARGRQAMEALQSEVPDLRLIYTLMLSHVPARWELLVPFVNGMMDGAGPQVRLIEGDEGSYYHESTFDYFNGYGRVRELIHDRLAPENRTRYASQVQMACSVYGDLVFAEDHATTAAERARWQHNVYNALATTDEYVWCYTERMSWWGNDYGPIGFVIPTTPFPGAEEGIIAARQKFINRERLGYDLLYLATYAEPAIAITAPAQAAELVAPATVTITTNAGPTTWRVEFFRNSVKHGHDDSAPFTYVMKDLPAGRHVLFARAIDGEVGNSGTSQPVVITVRAPTPPGGLPGAWSAADVGAVATAGSATFANGAFTVKGSGADIWNKADEFRSIHQPMSGDGEIAARVVSQTATDGWAKAGVMIRESTAAGAKHAFMAITPGNGAAFQRRATTGGSSAHTSGSRGPAPRWVRLARVGHVFSAYEAAGSATAPSWRLVGIATIPMDFDVLVGLAVTSHRDGALSTAVFDQVTVIKAPSTAN